MPNCRFKPLPVKLALRRLAKLQCKTQSEMLSLLILDAENQYLDTISIDSEQWEQYFKQYYM